MSEPFDLIAAQRRVFQSALKPLARLVALALLDHWSRSNDTFPSVPRLSAWTGICERSVKGCLASLEAEGAIRIQRTRGKSNTYDLGPLLTLPPAQTSAGDAPVDAPDQGMRCTGEDGAPVQEMPPTSAGDAPVDAPDQGMRCTGEDGAPVQEMPPTSAGDAPGVVQEMPPKEPIEGTQEGTHMGAPHEPPPSTEPPKPKPQKPPKAKAKAKRWTFVPDDWHPNDAHRAKARELGVSLEEQAELFRSHEFRTPKTDADRAFHGWLIRVAGWASGSRPGPAKPPPYRQSGADQVNAAINSEVY